VGAISAQLERRRRVECHPPLEQSRMQRLFMHRAGPSQRLPCDALSKEGPRDCETTRRIRTVEYIERRRKEAGGADGPEPAARKWPSYGRSRRLRRGSTLERCVRKERMDRLTTTSQDVESLIGQLAARDGRVRQRCRRALVSLGYPAVPQLAEALRTSKSELVRWEAAKTLASRPEPAAMYALVDGLEDDDPDVAWVAAQGLRRHRMGAWIPLLSVFVKRGWNSDRMRRGAHYVLAHEREEGLDDLLQAFVHALEPGMMNVLARFAASRLLQRLYELS